MISIIITASSDLVHLQGSEHHHDDQEAEGREPGPDDVGQLDALAAVHTNVIFYIIYFYYYSIVFLNLYIDTFREPISYYEFSSLCGKPSLWPYLYEEPFLHFNQALVFIWTSMSKSKNSTVQYQGCSSDQEDGKCLIK